MRCLFGVVMMARSGLKWTVKPRFIRCRRDRRLHDIFLLSLVPGRLIVTSWPLVPFTLMRRIPIRTGTSTVEHAVSKIILVHDVGEKVDFKVLFTRVYGLHLLSTVSPFLCGVIFLSLLETDDVSWTGETDSPFGVHGVSV